MAVDLDTRAIPGPLALGGITGAAAPLDDPEPARCVGCTCGGTCHSGACDVPEDADPNEDVAALVEERRHGRAPDVAAYERGQGAAAAVVAHAEAIVRRPRTDPNEWARWLRWDR